MAHHVMVFAKGLEAMQAFYAEALGLSARASDDPGFVEMTRDADVVVALHRLPEAIANTITITTPPQRRDDTALKICIGVADLDAAIQAVLDHGGLAKDPWEWNGRRYCECTDLEGNALQLFEP